MRFDFSDEQLALADAAGRLFQDLAAAGSPAGEAATAIADMGIDTILEPEAAGGLGLGVVDALAVTIEAGRSDLPLPLVELLIGRAARADMLLAFAEDASLAIDGTLDARLSLRGTRVPAQVLVVIEPAESEPVLVSFAGSNMSWETREHAVAPSLPVMQGVAKSLPVTPLDTVSAQTVRRIARLLLCGELLGIAESLHTRTVQYVQERRQFGKPVGSHQAVKHGLAEGALALETMRALTLQAAWSHDAGVTEADELADAAKAVCGDAARAIAESAIQFHGGNGFTLDYGLHRGLRRILTCGRIGGDGRTLREALARRFIPRSVVAS